MLTKDERKPNNISRVATRALLFNHFLTRGLRTEEELQFYVREFLNFVIPKHPVCPHHVAPWQAFSDIFFERKHSTFLFGSRSSGKTRMLSLLNNVEATFKPGIQICVDKDTPIDCLRNTKVFPEGIPIKDLIGRKFWVYSYSLKNQKVELKRGHSVHSQGFKKCVCIKYSWGKGKYDDFIIVDESHEVLLRDGLTYKKAKDIKEGDSLMPFVREWDQHNYPRVYAPGVGCVYEHQFAVSEIIGRVTSSEEVIHHESFNPWDTRVNQLKIMTRSDHQKLHARAGDHASKVFKEFWASMTEQERKSFSKRRVEARKANYPNNIQLQEYYKKFKTEWWKNLDPDYRKKLSDINTSNLPRMYGDENPAFRRDITRNDVLIALLSCQGVVKEMRERLGAKDDGFVYRRFQQYGWDMKFIRSLFSSKWILERKKTSLDSHVLSEYYTARRGRDSFDTENHTVTKVLDVGLREVYSLTVDDNHNYAAKGLFHKNCNAGAILSQAQKNYEYTLSYYEDDLLASTLKNSIQSHTELTNGSIISVITGGIRGFNGQHPSLARLQPIEVPCNRSVYPDGVPIGKLYELKKPFLVWSFSRRHQRPVLRKATAHLSGKNQKVYKVTYGWYGGGFREKVWKEDSIICTEEHPFLMRDGTYKRLRQLKEGASLMPVNFTQKNLGNSSLKYIRLTGPLHDDLYEHREVYQVRSGNLIPRGYVVHHKDHNSLNNNYSNLQLMSFAEHREEHETLITPDYSNHLAKKVIKSMTGRDVKPLWHEKEWLVDQYVNQRKAAQTIGREVGTSVQTISKWLKRHNIRQRTPAEEITGVKAAKYKDSKWLFDQYVLQKKSGAEIARECCASVSTVCKHLRDFSIPQRDASETTKLTCSDNHEILKIEYVGKEDVYNLEVEGTHNYIAKGLVHHNCKLRLDEIELIDWYAIQEAFSMTQSLDKWSAQDTLSSTRKFSFGSVQRLLSEAVERDITVYPWCIWESLEKCTRECFNDPIHGDCPVYSKKNVKTGKDDIICGGKAHTTSGFYPIEDFIKKVRLLDRNTWKAQWLCEKTGDSSTVYGEFFNEDVHLLKTEEEFMAKFQELEGEPMSPRHRRVSGIDFGGQFAFVRLVKSPTNRRRFYILEVYFSRTDVTLDTHIAKIKKLMWWGQGKEVIFGDHAARQDIIEFNNKGIPVHLAVKEIFNGINLVKSLLENQADGNPGIYLNGPRCEALINEFNSYSYKIRKDGLPDLDSIFKERDHCLDALRYALFSHMKGGGTVRTGKRRNF